MDLGDFSYKLYEEDYHGHFLTNVYKIAFIWASENVG